MIYKKLSDNISNTDPAYVRKGRIGIAIDSDILKPCKQLDKSKASKLSAEIINSFTDQAAIFLDTHNINNARAKKGLLPANYILLRDAGNKLPDLKKKKDRWLAVAGMPLEIGLARLSGMHVVNFKLPKFNSESINKSIHASLIKTINVANISLRKHWKNFDSFYIHIKETDIPGHDGNPSEKKRLIELIDKRFFKNLSRLQDCIICITGDHSTPCRLKRHSADPVPVLIYGKGADGLHKFSERNSKKGSIGRIYGKNLLKLLY
jgi:2,3-bisphosphoglycerate-independent phosphoglycerate mutase